MAHWFKYALTLMITTIPAAYSSADLKRYVQTIEDFQYHTNHHIQNVVMLALFLFDTVGSKAFGGLTRTEVIDYISLHDTAKTLPLFMLQSYGYSHPQTIGERLYEFYGIDFESLPKEKKEEFERLRKELNRIDGLIAYDYLERIGYLNSNGTVNLKGQMLKLIELIADQVERTKNPVSPEEFGKKMKSPSSYLRTRKNKNLFRLVMNNYASVANQNYVEDLELRRATTSCDRFFR